MNYTVNILSLRFNLIILNENLSMAVYKTEITSDLIPSDNPIHQRLKKPYVAIADKVKGDVLELGCGEGRGVALLLPGAKSYLGLDKIGSVIDKLRAQYPEASFEQTSFPPLNTISDDSFDTVVSFQVIEHIRNDRLFLEEIYRVLKPGGTAYITTPNRKMSLTRNPWHIREYLTDELKALTEEIFDQAELKGITGNEKVMKYYENNRASVKRIMRFDILDLQHRMPAFLLKIPYEIMNRINRNRLSSSDDSLVRSIDQSDYLVSDNPVASLDLFAIAHKK